MSTAFITQVPHSASDYPHDDHAELEALVSGVTQTSQSTLLLKKRKEMREVDDALDFMKEEFKTRMEACDERQREFERKQAEMKEQVNRFEKFIQENDAKRNRAEMKAKLERKNREQNEEKIRQLQNTLSDMQEQRKKLDEDLERLRRYQQYLERVVDASEGEYDEISDVLNRHKTLFDANADLKELVARGDQENDKLRTKLATLKRETQNAVLVQNSAIHGHQKRLETLRAQAFKLDIETEKGEKFAKDRSRESGQVVMSIKNLHARCLATLRTKMRPVNEKNRSPIEYLTDYLNLIQFRITDLDSIHKSYKAERELGFAAVGDSADASAAVAANARDEKTNVAVSPAADADGVLPASGVTAAMLGGE